MIAAALKKRFAKISYDSPEKDDDHDFYSSPDASPKCLRKSRWDSSPKTNLDNSKSSQFITSFTPKTVVLNETEESTPKSTVAKKLRRTPKVENKCDTPKLPPVRFFVSFNYYLLIINSRLHKSNLMIS